MVEICGVCGVLGGHGNLLCPETQAKGREYRSYGIDWEATYGPTPVEQKLDRIIALLEKLCREDP